MNSRQKNNADRFCELAEQIVNAIPGPPPSTSLPNFEIPAVVLAIMKANWSNHGGFDYPDYSDSAAIEMAVNDLLDHARELGFSITHQGRDIGAMGVCVRSEDGE